MVSIGLERVRVKANLQEKPRYCTALRYLYRIIELTGVYSSVHWLVFLSPSIS